jgi:hypothetical protein
VVWTVGAAGCGLAIDHDVCLPLRLDDPLGPIWRELFFYFHAEVLSVLVVNASACLSRARTTESNGFPAFWERWVKRSYTSGHEMPMDTSLKARPPIDSRKLKLTPKFQICNLAA